MNNQDPSVEYFYYKTKMKIVCFSSRKDAKYVLKWIKNIFKRYGLVYLSDYYDICCLDFNKEDNSYGWDSLKGAKVKRNLTGYFIDFRDPIYIPPHISMLD